MRKILPIMVLLLSLLILSGLDTATAAIDVDASDGNSSSFYSAAMDNSPPSGENQRYDIGNPVLTDIWVDPVSGNDARTGNNSSNAIQTVQEAWNRVPANTNLTTTGYRIQLLPGTYDQNNLPLNGWMASRYGNYLHPVIIQAANGPGTVLIGTPDILNFYDCRYLYLMGLTIQSSANNVVHLERCNFTLLKNMEIIGLGSIADYSCPQEDLKANQCKNVYLEDSEISTAWNVPVDFVGVENGHIIGNRIHEAGDWVMYLKGGSAHFTISGNELYHAENGGFSAGQGTGFEYMISPYLHYETYDIKFINNIIHDTNGAGMGVNGGYNILMAYNTLYRVGARSHGLEFGLGVRSCDGNTTKCQEYLSLGGWGTDNTETPERIPNRNIYVYNNIIYNPDGYQSQWSHFSVAGPFTPSPGSNIPSPARSDTNLQIKGNIIWNGPSSLPLGIEGVDTTLSASQLHSENYINTLNPQLTDPENGNLRPMAGGNVFTATAYLIPNFPGGDLPENPHASEGNLTNTVSVDHDSFLRSSYSPPGAFLSSSSSENLTEPPFSPVRLIFIHHSTGENWLGDGNGNLGVTLRDNNYFVSDTNYGWGPDSIGSITDIGHWWLWFRGPDSTTYLNALYNESEQHSSYSRISDNPGGPNEIVMFKSCFPNSDLRGNPDDPVPLINDNPLRGQDCGSEYHTVANAKGIYIDLLEYFKTRQDKLFVVITAPPLIDSGNAANARAFNNWLVNDWLTNYPYKNVFVFDFYNVLTTNGGNPNTNDVNQETGNHHRWWNNTIQHKTDGDNDMDPNVLEYPSSLYDAHPTPAGGQKASDEFIKLLNYAYHNWKNNVFTGLTHDVYSGESIQEAVNTALNGDIIMVHGSAGIPATYNENISINKLLLVRSASDGIVTIHGANTSLPVITVSGSGNGTVIQGFIITGGSSGILLQNNSNCTITENMINGTGFAGIYLYESSHNSIINNNLTLNPYGMFSEQGDGNLILDNQITNNTNAGVVLRYWSDQNQVIGNTLNNNGYGLHLLYSSLNTVKNNHMQNNDFYGIYIDNSMNNHLESNVISGNPYAGTALYFSANNNTFTTNNLTGNGFGMYLYNATQNNITNNNISSNSFYGVYLDNSDFNKLELNTIQNNPYAGISMYFGSDQNIIGSILNGNTIAGNGFGMYMYQSNLNTITGNNVSNNTYYGLYLDNSDSNTINANTINGNPYTGIALYFSSDANGIGENTISGNGFGIYCYQSHGGSTHPAGDIFANNLTRNLFYGIYLDQSTNMEIIDNTANNNPYAGITLNNDSNNNQLQYNNMNGNGFGLYVENSNGNQIYQNNFLNNTVFANDNGTNNWDNSADTGNYYNDWLTSAPRNIPGGPNIDHYPQNTPFTPGT